ncbi:hypothetical protein [Burkholderia cenocepacia]|uniref:hypothetical protein n=1 Tax=Burkholderia cenocepacia TaxID=95486 RepID=UPI002AB6DF39|nr:hypothetical protein [Burkholderia cenocepacia]
MSSKLEIEYLDYRFTGMLEITESGRTVVVDRQLESETRSKTLAWSVFDRFVARNDFAGEEDARANIVAWLKQLADPRPVASTGIAPASAMVTGTVATDSSTTGIISNLDWIAWVADWFCSGSS